MNSLLTLTSRNLKQYFRDKGAVFFSLLSMFIVIVLMFFFMGDSNTDEERRPADFNLDLRRYGQH